MTRTAMLLATCCVAKTERIGSLGFHYCLAFWRELLSLEDKFDARRNKTMCRETHRMSNIPMGLRCRSVSRVTERERERERPRSAAILVGEQFQ